MIIDCTAVVMAGGRSRRMGCDKATLRLGEQTLLQRVVDVVQPLFAELRVSVRAPRADLPWPQICDRHQDAGPLAGLCAALEDAGNAVDLRAGDRHAVRQAGADRTAGAAARRLRRGGSGGRRSKLPQPLAAFYSATCLATVRALLDETHGKRSLRAALDRLNVHYVGEADLLAADPGLRSFFDLDTPQDLIEAIHSAGGK